MNSSLLNKRIPTLLGILLIMLGIGITSFLVRSGTIFKSNAGPTDAPQNVRISNITATSFTISYTTLTLTTGTLSFGNTKSLGQTALDTRDQLPNAITPHQTHVITINKLNPASQYYFLINSGQTPYTNNGSLYSISTAPSLQDTLPDNKTVSGMVSAPDGSSLSETLIYMTTTGAQEMVTLPNNQGKYTLPLATIRSKDLSTYFHTAEVTVITLHVTDGISSSDVSFSLKDGTTIPPIVLSKSYDFSSNIFPNASSSASILPLSFSTLKIQPKTVNLQISTPKKDQSFTDQQPLFRGTALPNSQVTITIHSDDSLQTQVTTDSFGNWSFRPSQSLSPGQHTLTIQTRDVNGILQTITQSFVVFASGTQVNQTATPSATLSPSPSPTSLPSPTPSPQPSQSPSPSPTLTSPTPSPTPLPTQIVTSTPSPSRFPVSGNESIMVAGIIGVSTTVIGVLLLLLSIGGVV